MHFLEELLSNTVVKLGLFLGHLVDGVFIAIVAEKVLLYIDIACEIHLTCRGVYLNLGHVKVLKSCLFHFIVLRVACVSRDSLAEVVTRRKLCALFNCDCTDCTSCSILLRPPHVLAEGHRRRSLQQLVPLLVCHEILDLVLRIRFVG